MTDSTKQLKAEIDALKTKFKDLEGRLQTLEVVRPPELRAMSLMDVEKIVNTDPYVELEVLADWRHPNGDFLPAGRVIRADLYPDLPTYVRFGLRLGVPENHDEIVAKIREQADARREVARKELEERTRAEAEDLERRAEAARSRI